MQKPRANMMKEALFYEHLDEERIQCNLCPHSCVLKELERGNCRVRRHTDGKLITENFGVCSAVNFEPIEKKPLYHFMPGSNVLSVGSIGCNFRCNFCQNCEISQTSVDQYLSGQNYQPEDLVEMATDYPEDVGIAFTYNEPTVFFEFVLETAMLNHEAGLKNVMISNGFINSKPLEQLLPYIDGFNIDLKSFSDGFYSKVCHGELEPIKETLLNIKKSGNHLEITNLLIPSQNDELTEFINMTKWIGEELGRDTVLHLSRYFPAYKSNIQKTSLGLLFNFSEAAKQYLDYVYLGNVTGSEMQNTICSQCGKIVIARSGSFVQKNGVDSNGNCIFCDNKIINSN